MVSIRKPHIALVAVQLTWSNRLQITSLTNVLKCANLVTLRAANEADVLNLISKRKVSKFLQECKFSCQGTIEWCSITSDAPCISLLRFMCAHVGDFIGFLRYYLAPKRRHLTVHCFCFSSLLNSPAVKNWYKMFDGTHSSCPCTLWESLVVLLLNPLLIRTWASENFLRWSVGWSYVETD